MPYRVLPLSVKPPRGAAPLLSLNEASVVSVCAVADTDRHQAHRQSQNQSRETKHINPFAKEMDATSSRKYKATQTKTETATTSSKHAEPLVRRSGTVVGKCSLPRLGLPREGK